MSIISKLKHAFSNIRKDIVVVSGLPRSGTSMMMKMLEAGGVSPMIDGTREADTDNPRGYYEFERVKSLPKGDHAWLSQARGRSIKVISALLPYLPEGFSYRILFMRRNVAEIIASQNKMLNHRKEAGSRLEDDTLAEKYAKHFRDIEKLVNSRNNMMCLEVNYNLIICESAPVLMDINQFLDNVLDIEKMARVIEPSLHRQRV